MFCPRISTISFSSSSKNYQDVMMAKLNKKQLSLLKEMPAEQLMQIINSQAKSFIINQYLLTPEELLKKVESEYKRKIKSKRFYDYYEAGFFEGLYKSIILPLEKTVSTLPDKTEVCCHNLLISFDKVSEIADTSDGSWMNYYNGVEKGAWI